jgi:hypothetical protein
MTNSGYDLTDGRPGSFQARDHEKGAEMGRAITIRHSTEADRREIGRLAELDSRSAPSGDALLGFIDGELRAAVALDSGDAVADPFHPTAELVQLLRMRAGQQNRHIGFIGLRAWRHAAETA